MRIVLVRNIEIGADDQGCIASRNFEAGVPFMSAQIVTLVHALSMPEMFVVSAARVFRALRERTAPPCLCRMFRTAGLMSSLENFVFFQRALASDPARSLRAETLPARVLGAGESRLLHAIACWQRHPEGRADLALAKVSSDRLRRHAAASGRAFALDMLDARLVLPVPAASSDPYARPSHGVH